MTPERWQQIREVLEKALELSPEQRSSYLDQTCLSDKCLRREVEGLLVSSDDVRSNFLKSESLRDWTDAGGASSATILKSGKVFAERFELSRKLGEGGMGQVWLAEQTSPVRRQVAIKLIKAGMYDEAVVQRFQAERQSLAIMDHPAIAKVFDAGTTPQGQPFFVMEYVPGWPITEYCDREKLKIRDRLELFISTCDGVQHAHQKAILHRDLKPANILVVEVDGKPVPRIIDFGLAKAITHREGQSFSTQLGHFLGTPGYMSPEQADANVQDIDTRTDVYALGVVLYVLLVGLLPFETRQLQKLQLEEWLRKLREEEPPRPSSKVNTDRESSTSTSEARGTEPKELVSLLRGDLDSITMKALEKNRERRYSAPSELAADIRRYLNHEPVVARPASVVYRCGKFIKRHELAIAIGAVFAMILLAGAVAIVREARIARAQEARAEQRFDSLRKLTNSLLFEFHDSIEKLPGSTEARELVVRRALEYLDQIAVEAPDDPATLRDLAAAYERIGRIRGEEQQPHLGGAGSFEEARHLYEKALAIREKLVKGSPRDLSLQYDLLQTMLYVATANYELGDLDRALDAHQQRLKIQEQLLSASHDSEDLRYDTAESMIGIGVLEFYYGDYEAAVEYERRALAMNEALLDANPASFRIRRRVAISHAWLANALKLDEKYGEATEEYRRALTIIESLAARDPNNTDLQRFLSGYNEDFCRCLAYSGLFSEAQRRCQKAISIDEEMMKADKNDVQAAADVASSNASMGLVLYMMHLPRAALEFERTADSLYREVMTRDPESPQNGVDYALSLIDSGRIKANLHRPELARKSLEQAQEMLEHWNHRSPKGRPILLALSEARAVLKALPNDTVAILPH